MGSASDATWRKSTRSSGGGNGDCLEVARLDAGMIMVRDSKRLAIPPLRFAADRWRDFLEALKREELW
jgi:hypothetical protein